MDELAGGVPKRSLKKPTERKAEAKGGERLSPKAIV